MSDAVFEGCLISSFISLSVHIAAHLWRFRQAQPFSAKLLSVGVPAVLAGLLMVIPVFYLVYVGWAGGPGRLVPVLLLPLVWAHLAVYAWGTGTTLGERFAMGLTFFLNVPVLFLLVWSGAMLRFGRAALVVNWGLFLTGLTVWVRARF